MVVMKTAEKSSKPRGKNGNVPNKALLVAQEISFAKVLAGNDKKLRDRGVKRLQKWLDARSRSDCDLKKEDFMRLWKGLFYCMWMADKPLVQEEVAETISSLVHCLHKTSPAIKLIECFFRTMTIEWQGIDQHRLDKFLMLVRRFLRQSLIFVERKQWNTEVTEELCTVFEMTLLPDHANLVKTQAPLGLVMHFVEIFLEELAKVSKGNLDDNVLSRFLKVFGQHLAAGRDVRMRDHITRHVFVRLIEQCPVGLEFQEKYKAWQALGFPGGSIDMMERVEVDSEDEIVANAVEESNDENGHCVLDPRAGLVNVELPSIDFNAQSVAKLLEEYCFKKYTNAKTRKHLVNLTSKFEELAKGEFPLGMKKVPDAPDLKFKMLSQKAAEDLMNYKNEILNTKDSESEDESQDESLDHQNSEDEDNLKENHVDLQTLKKNSKRKTPSEKKLLKKKKVKLDEEQDDELDDSTLKVSKKESKRKLLKNKSKPKLQSKNSLETDAKSVAGSDVDAEFKVIAHAQITSPASSSSVKEQQKSKVPLHQAGESNLTGKAGTDTLLQHIAPHLTGSQKSKRRASCGAKLETIVQDRKTLNTEKKAQPTSESGKVQKNRKRRSLWDEPLQEGEYEVFIPKEEIVARKKRLSDANDSMTLPRTPASKLKNPFASPVQSSKLITPSSSSKKVNFVLQRNTAQAESEYFRTLLENPDIPYDAKREPPRGVLKPSPYSSPVNPFYKHKLGKLQI